jgi:hypothetical protein
MGTSISLIDQYDVKRLKSIEKDINEPMELFKGFFSSYFRIT